MIIDSQQYPYVKESDLRSIGFICRVLYGRSTVDLSLQEQLSAVKEYYSLIDLRNRGKIKLAV